MVVSWCVDEVRADLSVKPPSMSPEGTQASRGVKISLTTIGHPVTPGVSWEPPVPTDRHYVCSRSVVRVWYVVDSFSSTSGQSKILYYEGLERDELRVYLSP